jgi:hypothetical protein
MTKNPIVSIKEARRILGKKADNMSDSEVAELVDNLDVIAVEALRLSHEKQMKEDVIALANLIYDIYQDKKNMKNKPQHS